MELDVDDPTLLLEREYKSSLVSSLQTILDGGLGVANLGGALYLGNLLGQYALYGVRLLSYTGLVQQFFPGLLAKAVLLNTFPLLRNIAIQSKNKQMRQCKIRRRMLKTFLQEKAGSIKRKELATLRMGKHMKQLGTRSEDVVFDTRQEFVEI